ncbi:hypothetical protein BG004_006774 [Podila humilis]|nr:hypothetical protein BG004_006774 [Podila humilis]
MSASAKPPTVYNILCLGETQSGKSTLIESLRKYADPKCEINRGNIGDSIFSQTKNVLTTNIKTNNPVYYITKKGANGPERVNYGEFINTEELEDYEDELNERREYTLEREESSSPAVTYRLIDTPGLNDTSLFDEQNIAIIFKALADSIESINLVVITVANNPFTEGLKDALRAYTNLLPEFNSNIVFVHTKIDYAKLHHTDKQFATSLKEKKKLLGDLTGRDTVPHLLIDNNIGTKQVVRDCITQNTLGTLLGMARLNQPVPVLTMRMNKTDKMRSVDELLKMKYDQVIEAREAALAVLDKEQKEFLEQINAIKAKIEEHDRKVRMAGDFIHENDNEMLDLLYEDMYQQDFSILNMLEGSKPMYYPGKARESAPGFVHYTIDHIDIRDQNIKVLQKAGGVGEKVWGVRFRRRKRQNGLYHVKIYIHRKKKHSVKLEACRTDLNISKGLVEDHEESLDSLLKTNVKRESEMKTLVDELKLNRYLLGRVTPSQLDRKIFQDLVEAQAYVRDYSKSAENVERFYLARRDELEIEKKEPIKVPTPVNTSETSTDLSDEAPDTADTRDSSHAEFNLMVKASAVAAASEE